MKFFNYGVIGCLLLCILSCKVTTDNGLGSGSSNSGLGDPPASGPVSGYKLNCEEARFVHYLNIYRQSTGLNKLNVSRSAVVASRWHAQDMVNKGYFDHTEPNGRTFS